MRCFTSILNRMKRGNSKENSGHSIAQNLQTGIKSENGFIYRVAVKNDRAEIVSLLNKYYYPEEPFSVGNRKEYVGTDYIDADIHGIQHGTSLVAVDPAKNNKIVGVLITTPYYPKQWEFFDKEAKHYEDICKKLSEMLEVISYLNKNANVIERFQVDNELHIHIVAVHGHYRGKSIGYEFMLPFIELAKSLKYQMITVDVTSVYSASLFEKAGMQCAYSIAFKDYKDENEQQVINPPLPHTHMTTYMMQI